MNKNITKIKSVNKVKTPANAAKHFEILEKAASNPDSSSGITFYYENRDTNPLKNVISTSITSNDYTVYHKHDFFEINFVKKGVLFEHIGGRSFVLKEGELLLMSPKVSHCCYCEEGSSCYNLLFRTEWLKNLAKSFELYDPNNFLTSLSNNDIYTIISLEKQSDALNELFDRLIKLSNTIVHHVDLYENLSFENYAAEFLLTLTKFPRHEYNFISKRSDSQCDYTPSDMVRYITDNFNKITLDDTAAKFGYSRSQFHRIIKANTGSSFSEIILSMRMQRARHYLLNTDLPIKNIAYLLGIDSAEHFTRMFKKHRNMSPMEYRKQYKRK